MNRDRTDDEMEEHARRNLAGVVDHEHPSSEISVGGDLDHDTVMAELDAVDTAAARADDLTDDEMAALDDLENAQPSRLDLIKRATARYAIGGELWQANRASWYEAKAKAAREAYAAKVAEEKGRPVRQYRQGLDALTDEQRRARRAEQERERYKKAKGGTVRQSLAGMSPEERKAHQAELAKERQRRRRAKS